MVVLQQRGCTGIKCCNLLCYQSGGIIGALVAIAPGVVGYAVQDCLRVTVQVNNAGDVDDFGNVVGLARVARQAVENYNSVAILCVEPDMVLEDFGGNVEVAVFKQCCVVE